jgi:hypothetical protein
MDQGQQRESSLPRPSDHVLEQQPSKNRGEEEKPSEPSEEEAVNRFRTWPFESKVFRHRSEDSKRNVTVSDHERVPKDYGIKQKQSQTRKDQALKQSNKSNS